MDWFTKHHSCKVEETFVRFGLKLQELWSPVTFMVHGVLCTGQRSLPG